MLKGVYNYKSAKNGKGWSDLFEKSSFSFSKFNQPVAQMTTEKCKNKKMIKLDMTGFTVIDCLAEVHRYKKSNLLEINYITDILICSAHSID